MKKGWFKKARRKFVKERVYSFEMCWNHWDSGVTYVDGEGFWIHNLSKYAHKEQQEASHLASLGKVGAFWYCWKQGVLDKWGFDWEPRINFQ